MDKNDYAILEILKQNARVKASYISDQINMSVSSVIERIKKMEKAGIIKGYTTLLNEKTLNLDVSAVMEISLEHSKYYDSFITAIKKHPNIVDCYYLTGDYDFILKICCSSSAELESIHRYVKSLNGVSSTKTHFILKEIKNIYTPDLSQKNSV